MLARYVPRADVGGGLTAGALAVVIMLILDGAHVFDFNALVAALTVIVQFAAGWFPARLKSFFVGIAAFVAIIVASLVSVALGRGFDHLTLSVAIASLVYAAAMYWGPPRDADVPEVVAKPTTVPRQRSG